MKWYGQSVYTGGGSLEPIDKILTDRYGLHLVKKTAIECGANNGFFISTCLAFEEIGWKVINIEASFPNYNQLIINRPNSINYFYALSNEDNKTIIIDHYTKDYGGLDKSSEYETSMTKHLNKVNSYPVSTIKYSTLIQEEIYLFVLDVEGYEIKVIEGMLDSKYLPKIICIEHTHCGLGNIKEKLKSKYILDWNDNLNAIFLYE